MRAMCIVLDSVGIGEAPDADQYGDVGSATLPHIAETMNGLDVPFFTSMGLGNIPALLPHPAPLRGVAPVDDPIASYGAMQEVSQGKDTITGHWELAGVDMNPGFSLFPLDPPSFPDELLSAFIEQTGRDIIGNKAASGTAIIEELGEEHMSSGKWIVYTSADSVFQIAAHTDVVPLDELYRACEIARELCNPYRTGRVIARPFNGSPGAFQRTKDRRDYAFHPEEPFIHQRVQEAGIPVYAIGKIEDIYAHLGITESDHTGNTETSQEALVRFTEEKKDGLIIANFIDFDMIHGHRRDPKGYAEALQQTDAFFAQYIDRLTPDDLLIITADHGNDPTFKGTDHTREFVPLLVYQKGRPARNLGLRIGFYDVAQSLADYFGLDPMPKGRSFLS